MKYSLDQLKEMIEARKHPKYLFFWGHQPSKNGSLTSTCLSQWWGSRFVVDGVVYLTAEHWMMVKKAELFNDDEIREKILSAKRPAQAKALGRQVKGFNEKIWNKNKYDIVKTGTYHKFNQNLELKNYLLNTKKRVIVEASPLDPIWGIGLAADSYDAQIPSRWRGLNLLGFALMEVRDELMKL